MQGRADKVLHGPALMRQTLETLHEKSEQCNVMAAAVCLLQGQRAGRQVVHRRQLDAAAGIGAHKHGRAVLLT